MSDKETLVQAFHKAVDFEKRFGHRADVPEVITNWEKVADIIIELCQKKKKHQQT